MSEAQVNALIGAPAHRNVNPRFEVRPDAEWKAMRTRFDNDRRQLLNLDSTPDPSYMRLGSTLEHQVKVVWVYYPNPQNKLFAALSFDGHGKLIGAGAGGTGSAPHMTTGSSSAPAAAPDKAKTGRAEEAAAASAKQHR